MSNKLLQPSDLFPAGVKTPAMMEGRKCDAIALWKINISWNLDYTLTGNKRNGVELWWRQYFS